MKNSDFHLLGVAPDADVKEIKKAYAIKLKKISLVAESTEFQSLHQAYKRVLASTIPRAGRVDLNSPEKPENYKHFYENSSLTFAGGSEEILRQDANLSVQLQFYYFTLEESLPVEKLLEWLSSQSELYSLLERESFEKLSAQFILENNQVYWKKLLALDIFFAWDDALSRAPRQLTKMIASAKHAENTAEKWRVDCNSEVFEYLPKEFSCERLIMAFFAFNEESPESKMLEWLCQQVELCPPSTNDLQTLRTKQNISFRYYCENNPETDWKKIIALRKFFAWDNAESDISEPLRRILIRARHAQEAHLNWQLRHAGTQQHKEQSNQANKIEARSNFFESKKDESQSTYRPNVGSFLSWQLGLPYKIWILFGFPVFWRENFVEETLVALKSREIDPHLFFNDTQLNFQYKLKSNQLNIQKVVVILSRIWIIPLLIFLPFYFNPQNFAFLNAINFELILNIGVALSVFWLYSHFAYLARIFFWRNAQARISSIGICMPVISAIAWVIFFPSLGNLTLLMPIILVFVVFANPATAIVISMCFYSIVEIYFQTNDHNNEYWIPGLLLTFVLAILTLIMYVFSTDATKRLEASLLQSSPRQNLIEWGSIVFFAATAWLLLIAVSAFVMPST